MTAPVFLWWRRGETRSLDIILRDADGQPSSARHDTVELQIRPSQGDDVFIDGVAAVLTDSLGTAPGWSIPLDPVTMADVPLGEARALIWGSTGARRVTLAADIRMLVQWGRA